MNKKGVTPIFWVMIVIILIIGAFLYFKYYKLKTERDNCLSDLNNLKKHCNVTIQGLISQISELKENNSTLSKELEKYKTNVYYTQARIEFPLIHFPIKVYWILGILGLIIVLLILSNREINIYLSESSSLLKFFIWIAIILDIIFLLFSIIALIIDIYRYFK